MSATSDPHTADTPKIVVLCGQSKASHYALARLGAEFQLHTVIRERLTRRQRLSLVRRRARRLGWLYPLDRVLLAVYARLWLARQALDCREVAEVARPEAQPACCYVDVDSVNDAHVIELLRTIRPDLVVVLGTTIIREPVLASAPLFVNLHSGITPRYRGAHGCFWAAFHGDFENIGVTLHVVDAGIDTGTILEQTRIEFDPARDNFVTLSAKSTVAGAEMLLRWLRSNSPRLADAPRLEAPAGPSRLHHSPGLRDYLRFERANSNLSARTLRKAA
jgi:folate-dependent phosphoribosylglycinamide formyltransferase PurN